MKKKICIVTGANSGIGKQSARQLAEKGMHVIMACRNRARGEDALNDIIRADKSLSLELMIVDMGDMGSVRKLADDFKKKYDKLDVLIHNAAIFNITQKETEMTAEGYETVWATNHLGPVLLTALLMDKLKKSDNGRIITISSKGLLAKPFLKVDLDDPQYENKRFNIVNAYYQSKLAQVMFTYWLADKLKKTNVTVNCIRVTSVKVDISRHPDLSPFMKWVYRQKARKSIETWEMAETYTYLACSDKVSMLTGKYFDENNLEVGSGKYASNEDNINAVMALTGSYIPEIAEV